MKTKVLTFPFLILVAVFAGCTDSLQADKGVQPTNTPTPSENSKLNAGNHIWVHFIDVGQGDASLIIATNGTHNKTILIDSGKRVRGVEVAAFLEARGIKKMDYIIITNPDEDHFGGLLEVLNYVNASQVIESGSTKDTATYRNVFALIAQKGIPKRTVRTGGNETVFPGITMFFLNPSEKMAASSASVNDKSVATKLSIGSICFIFPGDSEEKAEKEMVEGGIPMNCQILKAGHHGSRTSSTAGFLSAVKPEIAIISAGANNSYGHPHAEALQRLAAANATVYRTDLNGSILVESNGSAYTVTGMKPIAG